MFDWQYFADDTTDFHKWRMAIIWIILLPLFQYLKCHIVYCTPGLGSLKYLVAFMVGPMMLNFNLRHQGKNCLKTTKKKKQENFFFE